MSNYDAAVGINADNINHVASQLHEAIYPKIFKGTYPVDMKLAKGELHYDAPNPPTVSFDSEMAKEYLAKEGDENSDDFITLDIDLQEIKVGFGFEDKDEFIEKTLDLKAAAKASIADDGTVKFTILTAKITIEDGAILEKIIGWLMPKIIEKLNDFLAKKTIEVPLLRFDVNNTTIEFETPVLKRQEDTLLAFTTLTELGEVEVPESIGVSDSKVSANVSNRILSQILNDIAPIDNQGEPFKTSIAPNTEIEVNYNTSLENPELSLGSGNEVTVKFSLTGGGTLSFYGPLPGGVDNFDFDLSMTASPEATGEIKVEDDEFKLELKSINEFEIKFDFPGMPDSIDDFVSDIVSALISPVRALISKALEGKEFKIAKIPSSDLKIADTDLTLTFTDIAVDMIEDNDNKKLLSVAMTPELAKKE